MKKYEFHVISNTHWDREWLKPFQTYRILLVEYIDKLLDIFDKDPEFKHFHLDSQSIPLEDYIEIRPENIERLKKHINEGRLQIGPWYDLPDMNMVDGECLIRNLLRGHKLSNSFGKVMKVGYTPTSNGQISQLPQIYRGFGIDSAIFYRGINRELTPTEYIWKSPDGSEVLGIRGAAPYPRSNFWMHALLGSVYGIFPDRGETWTYKWGQGGLPFRLAENGENCYSLLNPSYTYNSDVLPEGINKMIDEFAGETFTTCLPAFNGHDHNPPYPQTPRVIADANRLCENVEIRHSSLPKYIDGVRRSLDDIKNLKIVEGEMRHTNRSGRRGYGHLGVDTLSTRIYLKQENRRTENLLLKLTEPAAAMASLLGESYPKPYLDIAWRLLLINQSHDCMMGCSVEKVHEDMIHRFSEVQSIGNEILRRSLAGTVKKIDTSSYETDSIFLVAFNLLSKPRSEVVKFAVDLPPDVKGDAIVVMDSHGREIPVQMLKSGQKCCYLDFNGFMKSVPVCRYEGYLFLEDIPATGYKTFVVEPTNKVAKGALAESMRSMENEYLHVNINADGTINITCKDTGKKYTNLHYFEDQGEVGNAWYSKSTQPNCVFTSKKEKAQIRLVENGPIRATFETKVKMNLPVNATKDFKGRSRRMKIVTIVSNITLTKASRKIDIETTFENTVKDHKLRVMFPSNLKTEYSHAAMPFDVVKRKIELPDCSDWIEPAWPIHPNQGFVDVYDGKNGLAIINQGLLEYEVVDDCSRTIAITLLRSMWQSDGIPGAGRWPDEGYQSLGKHVFSYAIYPHAGDWQNADVYGQLNSQCTPIKVVQCGVNKGKLSQELSFLEVLPREIQVCALKSAEKDDGMVLRLFNPTSKKLKTTVTLKDKLKQVCLLDMEENKIGNLKPSGNSVVVPICHHKIITLFLK